MTRIIDTPKALLVEVPEGTYDFEVFKKYIPELRFLYRGEINPLTGSEKIGIMDLPRNISYGQPILAGEMGEEEWKQAVELTGEPESNYLFQSYGDDINDGYFTAHNSGQSLLRSHNLKPETTVVITKTITS